MDDYELFDIHDIEEARILTAKEYDQYKNNIYFRNDFWLMPKHEDGWYALCHVKNGNVYNIHAQYNTLMSNIYPILIAYKDMFKIGNIYTYNDILFKAIDNNKLITMKPINETLFNSNATDIINCCDYRSSDVCNTINNWFNSL